MSVMRTGGVTDQESSHVILKVWPASESEHEGTCNERSTYLYMQLMTAFLARCGSPTIKESHADCQLVPKVFNHPGRD